MCPCGCGPGHDASGCMAGCRRAHAESAEWIEAELPLRNNALLKSDDTALRARHNKPAKWVQDVFAIGNWVTPSIEPNALWRSDLKRRLSTYATVACQCD